MENEGLFPTLQTTSGRMGQWSRRSLTRMARFGLKAWPFLAGIALVLLVAYTVVNATASRALEQQIAAVRAQGEPLTLKEIAPPPVPDAENAAFVYQKAFDLLPKGQDGNEDSETLSNFLSPNPEKRAKTSLEQVQQVLNRNGKALELADQAAAMPLCRFPVNWEAGAGALFPHYGRIRELTRLFSARAITRAQGGDSAGAVSDLRVPIAMARHISNDPVLIGQLVEYAVMAIDVQSLDRVMNAASLAPEQSAELQEALDTLDPKDSFFHAMLGERAFGIWAYDTLRQHPEQIEPLLGPPEEGGGSAPNTLNAALLFPAYNPFSKLDESFYLHYMNSRIDSLKSSGQMPPDDVTRLPKYAVIAGVMLPVFEKAAVKRDEALARIGLAKCGLALQEVRVKTGAYPQSLVQAQQVLGSALPADPFTGKPFLYRPSAGGYRLYSVGPNKEDEGGAGRESRKVNLDAHAPKDTTNGPDDLLWTVSG